MTRLARTDLAIQSRQLLNQSIWCGLVFGLGVVLTVLNALPPVKVEYLVSGKVIASPIRAEALRQKFTVQSTVSDLEPARLRQLTLLDSQSPKQTQLFEPQRQVMLIGISSVWQSRCSLDQFHNWLDNIAASPEPERAATKTSTNHDLRLARWEYEAAKHYQEHHEFLESTAEAVQATVGLENRVFQLASTGSSKVSPELKNDSTSPELKLQLAESVQSLKSRVESLREKSLAEQNTIAGPVELTDGPKIQPQSRPIPAWMALSVVVLGLAAGSSAGWLQLRLQSGGVYDPSDVAVQLSRAGVPIVAQVQVSIDRLDSTDWLAKAGQKASTAGRTSGRNLILLSESILAIWFVIILGRACFDPLWRALLVESPLGALGRLLTGMP